ncbi:CD1375 family protein [Faecalibaculum rodentium]|uniref:CD1375 family protein n=1 Tax=Faecalibaculum rodentium TaxID=1702221 RepID=UPI0025A13992|nr:CD1375 family protein [Faecalibaculum rodentium]
MILLHALLFLILGTGGKNDMAVIYATLIVKGKKTFADVPAKIQEQVKEVLIDLELPELAEI